MLSLGPFASRVYDLILYCSSSAKRSEWSPSTTSTENGESSQLPKSDCTCALAMNAHLKVRRQYVEELENNCTKENCMYTAIRHYPCISKHSSYINTITLLKMPQIHPTAFRSLTTWLTFALVWGNESNLGFQRRLKKRNLWFLLSPQAEKHQGNLPLSS